MVLQTKRMRKKCGRVMCERDKCKEEKEQRILI
jgi:hypothetical protein